MASATHSKTIPVQKIQLTYAEAAAVLGLSVDTVKRRVAAKELVASRDGGVTTASVVAYVEGGGR